MGCRRTAVLFCLSLTVSICRSQNAAAGCPAVNTSCSCDVFLGDDVVVCEQLGYDAMLPRFTPSTTVYQSLTVNGMTVIRRVGPSAFSGLRLNQVIMRTISIETVDVDAFAGLDTALLHEIYLEGNYIRDVVSGTFRNMTSLTTLNLGNNAIWRLESGLFDDLTSLEYLHLDNNRLTSLAAGVFSNLGQLIQVFLFNNDLSVISADAFRGLANLATLRLDGNQLTRIESGAWNSLSILSELQLKDNQLGPDVNSSVLEGLDQLETLDLSNNFITRLSADVFTRTPRLRTVALSNNQLGDFHQSTFSNLSQLSTLRLTGNRLRQLPDRYRWLGNSSSVTKLYLQQNGLRSLSDKTFQGLASLQSLFLSKNKLRELNAGMFQDLARLSSLELQENEIEQIAARSFSSNPRLRSINLRRNKLETIPAEVFSDTGLTSLRTLEFEDNRIETIDVNAFRNRDGLQNLGLSINRISDIDDGTFEELLRLSSLSLDRNNIANISSSLLSRLSRLRTLNLNHNRLTTIASNPFFSLQSLGRLDLSNNELTRIERGTFGNLGRLTRLDVSFNRFSNLGTDLVVSDLTGLTHLNISYNLLSALPQDAFAGLQRMQMLDLRNNQLSALRNGTFRGLMSAQELHLHNNQLSSIASMAFAGLDALHQLSLSSNLLEGALLVHINNMQALTTVFLDSNPIRHLPSGAFAQCPLLDTLTLRHNLLQSLADNSSATITLPSSIRHLDIGYNLVQNSSQLEDLSDFFPSLESLKLDGNSLHTLPRTMLRAASASVRELDFSSNRLTSADLFDCIGNLTRLSVLRLDENLVDGIPAEAAAQLSQSVTMLSMRQNRVNSAGMSTLSHFIHLIELRLDVNRIHEFPADVFARMFNLLTLTVSDNLLQQLSNDTFYGAASKTLTHISLAHNHINSVGLHTFTGMNQLVFLDLTDNQITELTLPPSATQLSRLLLSRNKLASFPAGLRKFFFIIEMDMSFNQLVRLPPVIIGDYVTEMLVNLADNMLIDIDAPRLAGIASRLDFSKNQLRRISSTSNLFSALTVVGDVDFSHNLLPEVPNVIVSSMDVIRGNATFYSNHIFTLGNWRFSGDAESTVKSLVLRRNIISELPDNFTQMLKPSLVHLDLQDNLLLTLEQSDFVTVPPGVDLGLLPLTSIDWSEYMVTPELEQLDLAYNLWQCDCQLAWLRLLATQVRVDMATCAKPPDLIGLPVYCYNIAACDGQLATAAQNVTCEDGRLVLETGDSGESVRLSGLVLVTCLAVLSFCLP